jgi:hypothetical protein
MVPLQLLPHSVPVSRLLEVNSALLKSGSRSSEGARATEVNTYPVIGPESRTKLDRYAPVMAFVTFLETC